MDHAVSVMVSIMRSETHSYGERWEDMVRMLCHEQ